MRGFADHGINHMGTGNPIIDRILRETNTPNLLGVLAEQLTPTDLQSLLLEVYRRRAAKTTAAALLTQHEQNRFTRPAAVDPQVLLDFDRLAFAHANPPFTPIELGPVTPLGANSVVGLVDQNKAVATSRNTEVVSDSTNVLRNVSPSAGSARSACAASSRPSRPNPIQ